MSLYRHCETESDNISMVICFMNLFLSSIIFVNLRRASLIETSRVCLWCDNACGESWENTREACKPRGVAELTLINVFVA